MLETGGRSSRTSISAVLECCRAPNSDSRVSLSNLSSVSGLRLSQSSPVPGRASIMLRVLQTPPKMPHSSPQIKDYALSSSHCMSRLRYPPNGCLRCATALRQPPPHCRRTHRIHPVAIWVTHLRRVRRGARHTHAGAGSDTETLGPERDVSMISRRGCSRRAHPAAP